MCDVSSHVYGQILNPEYGLPATASAPRDMVAATKRGDSARISITVAFFSGRKKAGTALLQHRLL